MTEYIDREKVLEAYWKDQERPGTWSFEKLVNSVPAEDVVPVVHGKWVRTKNVELDISRRLMNCGTQYECSLCKRKAGYKQVRYYNFCPRCGAKMDKEK